MFCEGSYLVFFLMWMLRLRSPKISSFDCNLILLLLSTTGLSRLKALRSYFILKPEKLFCCLYSSLLS